MKSHINTVLLAVIAICLLKMAFYEQGNMKGFQVPPSSVNLDLTKGVKSVTNKKFNGEFPRGIDVYTPIHNGDAIPLLVYCQNCK